MKITASSGLACRPIRWPERYSAAAACCIRHCASSTRKAAGFTGLLRIGTSRARASSRTRGVRSAVIRIAGRSAPKRSRRSHDRVDAVAVVEVIVDQQCRSGSDFDASDQPRSRRQDRTPSAPDSPSPPSRVSMPSRICGSLSMQSTAMPDELRRIGAHRPALAARSALTGSGDRHLDRESRSAAGYPISACTGWPRTRRCARRSKDQARDRAPPWRRPAGDEIRGRSPASATPGCPARNRCTSIRTRATAPAAADQHASLRRVFDRVRDQVLQQPAQQSPVRAHRRVRQ